MTVTLHLKVTVIVLKAFTGYCQEGLSKDTQGNPNSLERKLNSSLVRALQERNSRKGFYIMPNGVNPGRLLIK
jgi:hypothetical protein